jgi:ankyrin repeat protein
LAPIHWATEREDSILIQKLLAEGADINSQSGDLNDTPLQHAIRYSTSLDIIKLLINSGANVNASQFPRDTSKHTALHLATRVQRSELIKYLIKHGADKSAGGSSTPYSNAIHFYKDHPDYKEIMNLLRPTNCSGQNQCPLQINSP